jgi:hypothetical protein
MPMSRHPISEQKWNNYGIIDRIRTNKYSTSPVAFLSRNKAGTWPQARLHTLTTFSTSFVMSIQSRPSVPFRDTCFAVHDFLFFFFSLFLCMIYDCVEEGTSGDVNGGLKMGMGGLMWIWHGSWSSGTARS